MKFLSAFIEFLGDVSEELTSSEFPGQRKAAEAQFRTYRVTSPSGEVMLDGDEAQVLHTTKSHGRYGENYVLTVFAVTPQDRYFLFKSNESGQPFLRELTADRARLVLKRRFRGYRQPRPSL